jgi:hypothetical protein
MYRLFLTGLFLIMTKNHRYQNINIKQIESRKIKTVTEEEKMCLVHFWRRLSLPLSNLATY